MLRANRPQDRFDGSLIAAKLRWGTVLLACALSSLYEIQGSFGWIGGIGKLARFSAVAAECLTGEDRLSTHQKKRS